MRTKSGKTLFGRSPLALVAFVGAMVFLPSLATIMPLPRDKHKAQKAAAAPAEVSADSLDALFGPADTLSRDDRRRFDYIYLEAMRQQNASNFDAAFDLLNRCLEINPRAAECYYQLAMYYSELDEDSVALINLEKAATLAPANDIYQERVAQYYIGTNNYHKAISAYENLYAHHHDRTDVLNILAQLYNHEKDYDQVLRCLSLIEQADGTSEDITLAKMNVYEQKGEKKMAYQQLRSLVDAHPLEANYKVMLGNWLMQHSREDEAYRLFSNAIEADPENEYALGSMYDYYRKIGNDSLADNLRDKMLLSTKTDAKTKGTMFRQVIQENEKAGGDSTKVLRLFDRTIAADPQQTDVAMLKAAYMQLKKMPQDSINAVFQRVLAVSPDESSARMQLIQSYWAAQRWDDIIDISAKGVAYNPDDMVFYYFLGVANYQKRDNDAALDALRRGVSEINSQSDAAIVSDFYAIMGDILHEKGLVEESFAAYDSCLQWKSDNITCLNNYAYYLSVLGKNLPKAEEMSYKTVKEEPTNATYLDTYAWILYQQKRYDEAKVYIEEAVKNDTDSIVSAVVIEHAGDIFAASGDSKSAIDYWTKAIERGGDKATLRRKISRQRNKK